MRRAILTVVVSVCFFALSGRGAERVLLDAAATVVPLVAIVPILLFIGLVIGAQAFQASPKRHAPAIVLALVPNIAEWAKTQVDGALGISGIHGPSAEQLGALSNSGVLYHGMGITGGGAVLAGLLLGAIAVFVIDRRFNWAAVYAGAATLLSFYGFVHAEKLQTNASPSVTFGFALVFVTFLIMAIKQAKEQGKFDWSPVDNGAATME